MRPLKKRPRGSLRSTLGDWLIFDERQLAWITIAISGVLFFALMSTR